ncbi:hypothetical protein SAMN02745163_03359 [Clostridium cavendishii DSM 21758]|uniref:Uncharacterized protein n=1 Tax=Clostridium cavendishii DSM 21758 TaxID=1121302 RepID=A0A1M6QC18_9CLOT|nr:hypothetical protein [Clostridium cavendishii]SHK17854.1 hypothetical protein SAMN02745163_03359 [Clostridium cavendishii DSM 21758]
MDEIFKNLIEEHFHKEIFNSLQTEITNNYSIYNLTLRANLVRKVTKANLDDIDVLRVYSIQQEDKEIIFKVLINCRIEIEEYTYRKSISEKIRQWFEISCRSTLENAELISFVLEEIKAYNK